ncbi:unnamed protein product [Penicillium egyptiacum]|uniref:Uncharacterized protein n=1 Tax=Penicillium egyptiacum TaxID=1303716 RepID=A0A9W4K7P4_9EURO|nr:unnamed protein product [Penicillium egyptiacum]
MSIIPLCCKIAWEVVYGLLYPSKSQLERALIILELVIDFGITYAAIILSPREWTYAPLVEQKLRSIPTLAFSCGLAFAER